MTDDIENQPIEDIIFFSPRKINIYFLGCRDHEVKLEARFQSCVWLQLSGWTYKAPKTLVKFILFPEFMAQRYLDMFFYYCKGPNSTQYLVMIELTECYRIIFDNLFTLT